MIDTDKILKNLPPAFLNCDQPILKFQNKISSSRLEEKRISNISLAMS